MLEIVHSDYGDCDSDYEPEKSDCEDDCPDVVPRSYPLILLQRRRGYAGGMLEQVDLKLMGIEEIKGFEIIKGKELKACFAT